MLGAVRGATVFSVLNQSPINVGPSSTRKVGGLKVLMTATLPQKSK